MKIRSYTPPGSQNQPQEASPAPPPLPYPNGWFCVGFSTEWLPGVVQTRPFMGEDLVIYRTRSGKLRASRPYCPHLGAHLGAGGTVDGEHLVCPFHKFSFDVDGKCVRTPFGPPPRASLSLVEITEAYGIVWAWHHHNGDAPSWQLPDLDLPSDHAPVYRATDMAGHPQEVCENSFDYGHIQPLHGVEFLGEVSPPRADGPFYDINIKLNRRMPLLGNLQHLVSGKVIGLGGICVVVDLAQVGVRSVNWVLATPIAPWRIRLHLAVSSHVTWGRHFPAVLRSQASSGAARAVSSGMLVALQQDIGRDFPIWHHKKHLVHPKLSHKDGLIGAFRKWASKFYPPTSRGTAGTPLVAHRPSLPNGDLERCK
ncbi:Rieske 2Fe-2S domain-containing protein [Saccharopolyspora spinosa]|uniref:cholesterol 7-desaturase n=1 Tax=Saccharopolyspora spinosa TaxID=60894 RepID=A0A2N3Y0A2_SACSN|nr:Rieske 2Fe-2S domain-containing protein [Saccharopolyspora spinosa]PKW16345.1 Rieske-like 2Fe-2S protein [Saccharopolyspora spinosa]